MQKASCKFQRGGFAAGLRMIRRNVGMGGAVGVIYMAPLMMEKPGMGLVALSQVGEIW